MRNNSSRPGRIISLDDVEPILSERENDDDFTKTVVIRPSSLLEQGVEVQEEEKMLETEKEDIEIEKRKRDKGKEKVDEPVEEMIRHIERGRKGESEKSNINVEKEGNASVETIVVIERIDLVKQSNYFLEMSKTSKAIGKKIPCYWESRMIMDEAENHELENDMLVPNFGTWMEPLILQKISDAGVIIRRTNVQWYDQNPAFTSHPDGMVVGFLQEPKPIPIEVKAMFASRLPNHKEIKISYLIQCMKHIIIHDVQYCLYHQWHRPTNSHMLCIIKRSDEAWRAIYRLGENRINGETTSKELTTQEKVILSEIEPILRYHVIPIFKSIPREEGNGKIIRMGQIETITPYLSLEYQSIEKLKKMIRLIVN